MTPRRNCISDARIWSAVVAGLPGSTSFDASEPSRTSGTGRSRRNPVALAWVTTKGGFLWRRFRVVMSSSFDRSQNLFDGGGAGPKLGHIRGESLLAVHCGLSQMLVAAYELAQLLVLLPEEPGLAELDPARERAEQQRHDHEHDSQGKNRLGPGPAGRFKGSRGHCGSMGAGPLPGSKVVSV